MISQKKHDDKGKSLAEPEVSIASRRASPRPANLQAARHQDSPLARPTVSGAKKDRKSTESNHSSPMGLNVAYAPTSDHKVDIVFVHSPGGTSRGTWSTTKDRAHFWPASFLPKDKGIQSARILTFGYCATPGKSRRILDSLLDFAKDLLFDLRYGLDEQKEELKIGKVPLIFVAHSIGGLVVKEKAYLQGQQDPDYQAVIKAVTGVVFFATPHRGSNLAETLNTALRVTMTPKPKRYSAELIKNSLHIRKLNEQFRHIAPRLNIVSFYEMRPTPVGLRRKDVMIVESDSSMLGYPGEVSRGLDANHNGVCKCESLRDGNYHAIKKALNSLIEKALSSNSPGPVRLNRRRVCAESKSALGISELPIVMYSFFRGQWVPGTCNWIVQDRQFLEWRHSQDMVPRFLWLSGGHGCGKSVMTSFIINTVVSDAVDCQYFFIRSSDHVKGYLSLLLRSIAYQIALAIPNFSDAIMQVSKEGTPLGEADPWIIWEQLFKGVLFTSSIKRPMLWIFDGIDQADDPKPIISMLSDIPATFPLRVLLTSRKTLDLETSYKNLPESFHRGEVVIGSEQIQPDLLSYISHELSVPGSPDFKRELGQRIVAGAQTNFLWVRLVVERINLCHRRSDVDAALQQLPKGMETQYDQMALAATRHHSPEDKSFAVTVLEYVTCSLRPLSIPELSQALAEDICGMMDFQRSIVDLCGGLVQIDNSGHLSLVHPTAREYLLSNKAQHLHVDHDVASERLFSSCMSSLMRADLRAQISRQHVPAFLDYAASSWSSHLAFTSPSSKAIFPLLKKFLTGPWVLAWVEYLAITKQLQLLNEASEHISRYSTRQQMFGVETRELEFLDNWAIDLSKILGKFGNILRRSPESIYKRIPPFCPLTSPMYQYFGKKERRNLQVTVPEHKTWGYNLARLLLADDSKGAGVKTAGNHIAMLDSSASGAGRVFVYDSSTFEEYPTGAIRHEERVLKFELDETGTLLATYGYETTKIWEIPTGTCKLSVRNKESRPRPLALRFVTANSTFLVGTDDLHLRSIDLAHPLPDWQEVADLEESELEGHTLPAANYMTVSQDGSLTAVAYPNHPFSAWETDGPTHIGHCWRKHDELAAGEVIDAAWIPHTYEILGVYVEGVVFKWSPYYGEVEEIAVGARHLSLSRDGKLFVTGDGRGTLKVFTTSGIGLLYQLASQDTIFGVTFGPNSDRIYDIRGSYGNVWEPNALLRFTEQSSSALGSESERESTIQTSTVNYCQRVDSITTVASSPQGQLYCYGTERGAVHLHHTKHGKLPDLHSPRGFLSIDKISFSADGKYVCFSDLSKRLFVKSIAIVSGEMDPVVETVAEVSMKSALAGAVASLIFDASSSNILVCGTSSIHTISLSSGEIKESLDLEADGYIWNLHPVDQSKIIGFGPNIVQVFDWNLHEISKYQFLLPVVPSEEDLKDHIGPHTLDRIQVSQDGKNMVAQLSRRAAAQRHISLLSFNMADLAADITQPSGKESLELRPTIIIEELSSQIHSILAFLSKDRLIFLSKAYTICSWQLPAGSIKELFSLPGDWISKDCLAQCSIWPVERSFLCPRNGEVGVVKCALI